MDKRFIQKSDVVMGNCAEILPTIAAGQVSLVVTSPPYFNQKECAVDGKSSDGQYKTLEEYFVSMEAIYTECKRVARPGAIFAINIGSDTTYDLRSWTSLCLQRLGLEYVDTICWNRGSGNVTRGFHIGSHNRYYPFLFWESVFIYKKNQAMGFGSTEDFPRFEERFKDMIELSLHSNVWNIPQDSGVDHPAPFPIKLAYNLIACYTEPNSIILDPFGGSGTVAIAANKIGNRKYLLIELIKERYEYALRRISENNQESLF
jgi:modification methylase